MKAINRASIFFDRIDNAYSDLYEKHLAFEQNPCFKTSEDLKTSIEIFYKKFQSYKYMIRDLYFKKNWL